MSWPFVTLGSLEGGKGNFVDGPFGSNLKSSEYTESGVPLIQLKNIKPNKYITKDLKFVSQEKADSISRHSYKSGDVCIAKLGAVGTACIIPDDAPDGIIVADVVRFRGDKSLIDYKYFCHFLNSPEGQRRVLALSRGSTRTRTNLTDLKKVEIPLPPLDEQKRIAAILDKADAIRHKRQQAIQLADDFLRSVFLDMFGDPVTWNKNGVSKDWTVKRVEEISLLKRGYDLPKQSRLEGKIPIYAANGVTGTHNEFKVKGPGVITGRSGTIGKVIYSENDFWPLNTALYVTNFYGNNPKYIEWYLRFLNLERYVQGAGVPTLNRNLFLKEVSAVPPKADQDRFEIICELVGQLIFKNLDFNKKELFKSLSQKAFAGEL